MHACRSKPTTITLVFFIAQINQAMESRMLLLSILGLSLVLSSAGSGTATKAPVPIDPAYKDPNRTIHARLKSLMGQMTLEEKIGQMAQLERGVATPEILRDYSIGSLLSGGGSTPMINATAAQWVGMVNWFQNGSISSRLGIPMIYGIDAVHGHNNLYGATIFPHNIGLGATGDAELVKRIGAATALEVRATGIPYTFAPCVAVCRDPRWGRCYESYSEDPRLVIQLTKIIEGLQGEIPPSARRGVPYIGGRDKIAACAKHFVGDGGTTDGLNENNTVASWHELFSIHMPAYYHSVFKGVSSVMVSFSSLNGLKMHANRRLINDFLKGILRFRGFVISDWQGVDKIYSPDHSNYSDAVLKAINAGIDMVMLPYNHTEFISIVKSHVDEKRIHMSRINDAVERILRVKFSLGLFETPMADYSFVDKLGHQRHRDLAREAVRKSLVLLKNSNDTNTGTPLLPLPKNATKILVAGAHGNNLALQCGGWTISWNGMVTKNITIGTTVLNGILNAVDPATEVVYSKKPSPETVKAGNFSYAVVVVGEPPYAESQGDNSNLTIPEPGLSTMRSVCGSLKCVVVLISGRPLVVEPYLEDVDALVAAWLPGSEGQGVADVLFGDYGFTGKSPRTWFRRVDQLPMNVGDKHYDPLFPYGFGLTTRGINDEEEIETES